MSVQQPQAVQRVEDGAGAARPAVEQLAGHHALPHGQLLLLEHLVPLLPAGRRRRSYCPATAGVTVLSATACQLGETVTVLLATACQLGGTAGFV